MASVRGAPGTAAAARSWFLTGLTLAAIAGFVLRLAFGLVYWTQQPLTRDEREYLSLARGIASGRGFVYDADVLDLPFAPFGRAPGYPAFLAAVGGGHAVVTAVPTSVKIAQSIAGAIGVCLVGLIAARLAGRAAGLVAAVVAAASPPLVWIASYAFSEAIAWPLALGCVWLFNRALADRDRFAMPLMIVCGLLAGATTLVRPAFLAFVAVAAVWLLVTRRPKLAVVLAVATILPIAPWTIRTSRDDGRFVLVATEGGVTFWTGNQALATGDGDLAANLPQKIANQALRAAHPGLDENAMEPIYYRDALAWIRGHPWQWLTLEGRKLFYLVVPTGASYRVHSARYYDASVASYGLLLLAGVAGAWRLAKRRSRGPGLWCLLASAVLVSLVFFPQERFRLATIDPVLIVCAGGLARDRREVVAS